MYTRKKNRFLQLAILFFLSSFIIQSFNDGKNDKKDETSTIKPNSGAQGSDSANLISSFKEYKLEKTTLVSLAGSPTNAKKIILKVSLDDLKDPKSMKLWLYPAKDHKDYGEGKTKIEIPASGNVVFTDTKDIVLGNNELSLKKLKEGNQHTGAWIDFDYLLFTPYKDGDNLAFKVSGYKNNQLINVGVLPVNTNPCPPAKPDDNN